MRLPTTRLLTAMAIALIAASAMADVPTNMNVQGRLTDGSGSPVAPGLKIFTFKIFDAEVGGVEVWPAGPGEDQTLPTDDNGLWNADIGKFIPLPASVFDPDTSRWLQVTVDDGVNPAETLSRVKLNTSPYSYRAHSSQNADSLGGQPASGYALTSHSHTNTTGWTDDGTVVRLNTSTDSVGIGTASPGYNLDVAGAAAANSMYAKDIGGDLEARLTGAGSGQLELWNGANIKTRIWGGGYGEINLFDGTGVDLTVSIDAGNTGGGFMNLNQEDGTFGMRLAGGSTSSGSTLSMYNAGGSATISFNADLVGSSAAVLPNNAIDDAEIINEPGIVQGRNSSVTLNDTAMQDIIAVTINAPTSGYVFLQGRSMMRLSGTTSSNKAQMQIDQIEGGSPTTGVYTEVGLNGYVNTGFNFFDCTAQRTYSIAAGSHTYRLEAKQLAGSGGSVIAFYSILTAMFIPTSYGAVTTVATQGNMDGFSSARAVSAEAPNDVAGTSTETLYEVDLRDLELRAAKLEAEAQAAQLELIQARMDQQQRQSSALNTNEQQER